jgi:hypothetical protein
MAANKTIRLGPVALTNTLTTNIWNPPTLTGGVGSGTTNVNTYYIIKHIRIVNTTSSAATYTLAVGTTGVTPSVSNAFMGFAKSVPANQSEDWYGILTLDVADFLVGGSGTASALTIEAEAEIGIR